MPKTLTVPKCVQFNRAIWNSDPFVEHYLFELKAKRYYLLDDSDCRTSLINLFSILDFWTLHSENQPSIRAILSSLCIVLAVNIRKTSDSLPLVEAFDEDEFALDPVVGQRFEKPISKWSQISEEIRNAVRSVERFDIIAPALAWGVVRFFAGQTPLATTVQSELDRWQRNGTAVQYPRGCLAFLDRKLPLVKNFTILPSDVTTLMKVTGVFFKVTAEQQEPDTVLLRRQLGTFTKCFIEKKLGPWMAVAEIAPGSVVRQTALIEALQKHNDDPRLTQSVNIVSRFCREIASRLGGFTLPSHYVYAAYKGRILSYLDSGQSQNSELSAKIHDVRNVLSTLDDATTAAAAVSVAVAAAAGACDTASPATTECNARQIAKTYMTLLPPDERLRSHRESLESSHAETATTGPSEQSAARQTVRKKRRRRKKES